MNQNCSYCSVSQKLVIYVFVIGLFLQNCNGVDGLSIPMEKRQQYTDQQVSRQGLIKGKKQNRLQGRAEEQITHVWFIKGEESDYMAMDNEKEEEGEGVKKENEQTKKRKRIENQENKQVHLNGTKHRRLENLKKAPKKIKKEKNRKKSGYKNERGNVRGVVKQKRIKSLLKTNQQVNGKRKGKELNCKPGNLKILEKTNGQAKKKRKNSADSKIGEKQRELLDLPEGILQEILSYLPFSERMLSRGVNHLFYTVNTGYKQVGLRGVAHKPDPKTSTWTINKTCSIDATIDFEQLSWMPEKKLTCTPDKIPSFAFYVLMRKVANLPKEYWPYLKDSQIHEIDLGWNDLGNVGIVELGESLQGKVRRVNLWFNNLEAVGAERFAKSLQENTSVREFNLSNNKLGNRGADEFTKHVPRTIRKVNLSNNKLTDAGAIAVANNVKDKEVEEIKLEGNKIENKGAMGVLENLQNSSVKKLSLGVNKITDEGVVKAAKYILSTSLEELYLGGNKITNKGAIEIVKGCQGKGTKMKRLGLCFNKGITDEGVLEIAKNVERTVLEEIDLRQYKLISKKTQQKVRKKCPHIKWIFENEEA